MIVRDYKIGNTRIRVDDSCCVSKEEAARIMDIITDIACAAAAREEMDNGQHSND